MRLAFIAVTVLLCAAPASAQTTWTYALRLTAESTSLRGNAERHVNEADGWSTSGHLVAAADAAWTAGDRLRVAGALAGVVRTDGNTELRVRELYSRASAASWLDVEAGKRILRWGVAYGFSPAGVLDPPRMATDPGDRLQLNEGRLLARADAYKGLTSFTIAVAERRTAARLSSVLPGGVEVAAIAAGIRRRRPSFGGTVTHVIGQQLEWHIDAMVVDEGPGGRLNAAAGIQYTFARGVNVVVEYHRNGHGLSDAQWSDVLGGRRAPGVQPTRRNHVFTRVARTDADARLVPELIVIANVDDGGWTLVPSLTWSARRRLQVHVRATGLHGPARAVVSFAPFSSSVAAGVVARF